MLHVHQHTAWSSCDGRHVEGDRVPVRPTLSETRLAADTEARLHYVIDGDRRRALCGACWQAWARGAA